MRIRIDSQMARQANEYARTMREREPYETTTWEGEVEDGTTLEGIFRAFNRVEEADAERLARLAYRLPSLSVGDTVTLLDTGKAYEVASMGFTEVVA